MTDTHPVQKLAIIGAGLIGSSIIRAAHATGAAASISLFDHNDAVRDEARGIGLGGQITDTIASCVDGADLVIICTPVGAIKSVLGACAPALKNGAIVSDVGSVKSAVAEDFQSLPSHVHAIPGHPVAGTEQSGPSAGFATLFDGRWCILTPPQGVDQTALDRLTAFWTKLGANVELMTASHHDRVLAITSHVPHLIAYNIVGTASDLEQVTQSEVIKYSAGGFRDFTRIAASDPTMWRDVFLTNRDAVLEMLGRFTEDLTALQRAIRDGNGDALHTLFTRTRDIRRNIVDAGQETAEADFGRLDAKAKR